MGEFSSSPRPDIARAFEKTLVRKNLFKYSRVAQNKCLSSFQVARKIPSHLGDGATTDEMWHEHSRLTRELHESRDRFEKNNGVAIEHSLLDLKIDLARRTMETCELCERRCHVRRYSGESGFCGVGNDVLISSEMVHLGEEYYISPSHTVFFMGCNFKCQYCQNWTISQWHEQGYQITPQEMTRRIAQRRKEGCRNVNFVGGEPTPYLPAILEVLRQCDVNVPVVWNSNFYMSETTMQILDGVVDMYLPDFKYGNSDCALRLSKVPNYFEVVSRNHLIAVNQAEISIRHLVLPNHVECCSKPVLRWIAENIREKCVVNIMDQYRPEYKAKEQVDINRKVTEDELQEVIDYANQLEINHIE